MNATEKKNLIGANAAIWAVAILTSFTLPLVTDSLVDGRGDFLRMHTHVFPLVAAMGVLCSVISKSIDASFE